MALETSSSHDLQLAKHIESIKTRTERLSIAEEPCQIVTEEHDQFITRAKQQINYFTQLLREVLNGSLNKETVASLDVEILDIHWNRFVGRDLDHSEFDKFLKECYGCDFVLGEKVILDIPHVEHTLEEELLKLVQDSFERVKQLTMSDEYCSLHDDLEALREEQTKWIVLDYDGKIPKSSFDFSSESSSDSEDEIMSDPMLGLVD